MGVYLIGVYLMERASHGRVPRACISWACTSWACTSRPCISWACISPHERTPHGCVPQRRVPHGVYLIYESSSRAGHGWRESLYRHQGYFKASDCGRLGRQAAGPLERAPRGEELPKRLPNGQSAAEAKAAALHPKRYQILLSKLSTREVGEAGKRSAGNRIGYQVTDRQVEDRQTGRNKADGLGPQQTGQRPK